MSVFSISTPRTDQRKHTQLSFQDLNNSSDSDSRDQILVDEIQTLKSDVQQAKKRKRQLDLKIEGLQHDLQCAQRAKEIGNVAAASVAKQIAAIFGEALKEEDLIIKVQELQERAKNAHQEVERLKIQLGSLQITTPQKQKSTIQNIDQINENMQTSLEEERKLDQQIIQVDNQIELKQNDLRKLKLEVEDLTLKFNGAIGSQNLRVSEIRDQIIKNSDEYILEQCSKAAQSLKIPFDPRMRLSGFIDDLRQRIISLRRMITPSHESDAEFQKLSQRVEASLAELRSLNSQIHILERQKNDLKFQLTTNPIQIVEDPSPFFEQHKQEQDKRTKKLRKSLKAALESVGYDWIVPKSQKDVCELYIKLIRSMQNELAELNQDVDPEPDLTVLQSKVKAVRRQNREIRHRIKAITNESK